MPTTKPRYTVTDTRETERLLDLAQRRWPEVSDRRQLLLRLVELGGEALEQEVDSERGLDQRRRQLTALARAESLLDADALLSDAAWR